jgi:hypothetical protein
MDKEYSRCKKTGSKERAERTRKGCDQAAESIGAEHTSTSLFRILAPMFFSSARELIFEGVSTFAIFLFGVDALIRAITCFILDSMFLLVQSKITVIIH